MIKNLTLSVVALALCSMGLAAEKAPASKPLDLKKLPVNKWVEVGKLTGFKMGGTGYGGPSHGLVYAAGEKGLVVCGTGRSGQPGAWRLDWTRRSWVKLAPGKADQFVKTKGRLYFSPYAWGPAVNRSTTDGRRVPFNTAFYVNQVCYDPDRKVIVGHSRGGETVEASLPSWRWDVPKIKLLPPAVTAGSLCYDPVNKEVVLATGGFSPVGGTDGTWLYDGRKKAWRKLEGPKEVDAVRLPLEKLHDRLRTLRWLTWKNLDFRATGREKRLDGRSKLKALAKESGEILAEIRKLAGLAKKNSGTAKRGYHKKCLSAAGKLLDAAAGKLAGIDDALRSGSPQALEKLYRGKLLPALADVENALFEVEVTPEPRMSAKLVYDSKNKVIVCFGGDGQDRTWGDTWVYHCAGRWWERRRPKLHPLPRNSRAMAFDARNGVVVLLDSKRWARGNRKTWIYDAARNEWKLLAILADKGAFWLEYDAAAGCLVAFDQKKMNKAWVLKLDIASAKPAPAKPAPEVVLTPINGQYVLRDTAKVAELRKWKSEMDAWVRKVPANTWVKVPTHGTGRPNWGRSWSSIVYDPSRQQLYYRDGGHGSYHGAVTDHYDIPTGRWFRSDRRYGPPWPMGSYFAWGRSFSYAPWATHTYKYKLFYNPLLQHLQRTGGSSIHDYDPDTGRWSRERSRQLAKGGGAFSGPLVPGVPDGLVQVLPFTRYGVRSTTSVWHQTADGLKEWPSTGPLPRYHNCHELCFFFDPKRKRVMYYGGGNPKPKKGKKAGQPGLFALDISVTNPKWVKLETKLSGDKVYPIPSREVVYIPRHDAFLMLEGFGSDFSRLTGSQEVWRLDARENVFRRVKLANGPGIKRIGHGAWAFGLQYDPVTDLCFYIAKKSTRVPSMYAFRYVPTKK
jgi:hypothetical protein